VRMNGVTNIRTKRPHVSLIGRTKVEIILVVLGDIHQWGAGTEGKGKVHVHGPKKGIRKEKRFCYKLGSGVLKEKKGTSVKLRGGRREALNSAR